MTEQVEKKKKVYKLATELNLSSETIIEFLNKKGYSIKSHMSTVTEEMLRDIVVHFKKDKDVAEKHHRKIAEIRESRKKIEKRPEEVSPVVELHAPKEEKEKPKEEKVEHPEGEPVSVSPVTEVIETPVQPSEETQEPGAPEIAEPVQGELPLGGEEVPTGGTERATVLAREETGPQRRRRKKKHEEEAHISPLEKAKAQQRTLKVMGKIELRPPQRQVGPARGIEGMLLPPEVEEHKKKKKKKKKLREEVHAITAVEEEEGKKKKKKKKLRHHEIDTKEVEDAIRRTLQEMDDTAPVSARALFRRKKREKREQEEQRIMELAERDKSILHVTEYVTVGEIANLMNVDVSEVIAKCIGLGLMVSINQRLDKDTIQLVADEFGLQVEFQEEFTEDVLKDVPDLESTLKSRAPVVTIMGHVDHGKTSLLDYIRSANVVAGEAGGITQHIGAYEVTLQNGRQISFLDTPGHEAFTAMRARGAQVTDIVVLVVATDDSVMPQTVEAINHAQAANVPIIIAMNKIDKADANPDRIRQQLSDKGILVEEWGGKYQSVELSARSGKNIELLLEKILLEAEVLELKANPDRLARGTIIEAQLDKGKGIVGTVLVQKGTLRVGDAFVAGIYSGRVRSLFDERGNRVEAARPSTPVQVTGFDGVPQAGDVFVSLASERYAREISLKRQQLKREQDFRQIHMLTLDDISKQIQEGVVRELKVIVKGDVDGSVEALGDALMKISTDEVKVNVIHRGVGAISESDVLLATASSAVIIGFHVRPNLKARQLAEQEKVDIRLYNIIYDAINEVHDALEGLLAPEQKEEITATVEIRQTFRVPKAGTIAGCYVQQGKITRNTRVRLVRDGIVIFDGGISSLKRFKDDVREVEQGFECGIGIENYNDLKVGDVIEGYRIVETKRKLA
ncbi:MAG: translation initiation factor IF-2 [Bacteroidota bacterium]